MSFPSVTILRNTATVVKKRKTVSTWTPRLQMLRQYYIVTELRSSAYKGVVLSRVSAFLLFVLDILVRIAESNHLRAAVTLC